MPGFINVKRCFMTELTKEQYEQVPDFLKDGFEQVGDAFVSKDSKKVASLKASLDNLDAKSKSEAQQLNERLAEIEAQEAEKIKAARQAALDEARSKGDVDAIEQRYQEQLSDAVERARIEATTEAEKQFTVSRAKDKAKLEVAEMVAAFNPVDDNARELLTLALSSKQQVTDDGKIIYTNDDGSASSLDAKGFLNSVIESDKYSLLKQANPTTRGAGILGGQIGGSAPTTKGNTRASLEQRLAKHGL